MVHAHIAMADDEGNAFGGHMNEGCVIHPFAEVFIHEMDAVIERKFDSKINLWPLQLGRK